MPLIQNGNVASASERDTKGEHARRSWHMPAEKTLWP